MTPSILAFHRFALISDHVLTIVAAVAFFLAVVAISRAIVRLAIR